MKHLNLLKKERVKKMINLTPEELYDIFPPYVVIKKDNDDEKTIENSKWDNLKRNDTIIKEEIKILHKPKFYLNGCLTCGKSNFWVKYHGNKHLCLECRKFLKSKNGNHLKIFLDKKGDPLVYEEIKTIKINKSTNKNSYNKIIESDIQKDINFKKIKNDEIYYHGLRCLCTISDVDELIIIPYD